MKRIYILFLAFLMIACKQENQPETTVEPVEDDNTIVVTNTQFQSENMQLDTLTNQQFAQTIKANGYIDVPPQNKASVTTFLGGYVKKTYLLVGDVVKKGQLVATLENTQYIEIQQQYLEVAEQLDYLKSEFNRQKTLFDEKITSEKNYLKAQSNYKTALATYNGLRQKLKMMNISPERVEAGNITSQINLYAPISGNVTNVKVSNGTFVSPADVVLEIANTEHIHLELAVFEKDILNIKKGQNINFKVPEASKETFKADVHLVGTAIDETNRTIQVHAHIQDEEQANFVIGMFVEADILTHAKESMALPKEAVAEIDNDFYALVLNDKNDEGYSFEKIKLEVGTQTEAYVELTNPENFKGKQFLVKGGFMLLGE